MEIAAKHWGSRVCLSPRRWSSVWLSVAFGVLGLVFPGARSFAQQPISAAITPAGQIDLARLVDLAADRLKVPIEYDASTLKGTITLRLDGGITDHELWELTNRVLAARGYTTVRSAGGSGLSVVKLSDAKGLAGVRDLEGRGEGTSDSPPAVTPGFVSSVVRIRHRAAKDVVEAVKLVLSKEGGTASPLGDSGLILVADLAPRVAQAQALIELLDAPTETTVEEVETRFLAPAQLVTLVQQVIAKRAGAGGEAIKGEVLASPNAASVLVIAPRERMSFWKDLLAQLDKREPVETVTYAPKYFEVKEVAKLIEQTVKEGPTAAATDDRFRLVPDELTGSLIVTAAPSQHERIRELIQRLDSVSAGTRKPVKTFIIRNRPVADVLGVLEQLMDAGVLDAALPDTGLSSTQMRAPTSAASSLQSSPSGGVQSQPAPNSTDPSVSNLPSAAPRSEPASSRSNSAIVGSRRQGTFPLGGQGEGNPASSASSFDRPLSLTSDSGTNSIIAVGEPRLLAQLESLLATIDVRQPQVLLEVMLVSLTEAQGLQLGVEIEKLTNIDSTVIRLASLFGLSTAGAAGRVVGDAVGFTGTALNPGDFSLVVRALQSMNNGRSLSAPQVLVNNNQQAVLSSVLQQPFASTNASSTVATTSFGGTQDAGTTLTIRPQIAEGDHLVLQYSVALSSFVGSSGSATLPPPRQQNTVQSTVTIPDGFTVVVGGLELETESKSVTQVPLLGDIPLVGELFKNRDTSRTKSRFFVFIRAGVLRSSSFEDLKYLSSTAATNMGIDDGFPEVEPRVMR